MKLSVGATALRGSMHLAVLEPPPAHPLDWLDWMGRRSSGALSLCESNVYFIQCNGAGGPIKIGMARDVAKRMAQFRVTNPFPLVCLAQHQAPFEVERALHQRFSDLALGGEWFRASDDVLQFAEAVGIDGPRYSR